MKKFWRVLALIILIGALVLKYNEIKLNLSVKIINEKITILITVYSACFFCSVP